MKKWIEILEMRNTCKYYKWKVLRFLCTIVLILGLSFGELSNCICWKRGNNLWKKSDNDVSLSLLVFPLLFHFIDFDEKVVYNVPVEIFIYLWFRYCFWSSGFIVSDLKCYFLSQFGHLFLNSFSIFIVHIFISI